MCGRFGLFSDLDKLADQFGFAPAQVRELFRPSYNVAPTQDVLAVAADTADGSAPEPNLMRWGLIAPWARPGERPARPVFNARAETIADKPMFRRAFARRRGLVLADGFYEWARHGSNKQAHWIARTDARPVAFAAIWEYQGGSGIYSCAIATTAANELMEPIHHRMPVILDRAMCECWLDPTADRDELLGLLEPRPWPTIAPVAVSARVGRVANNDPDLISPIK